MVKKFQIDPNPIPYWNDLFDTILEKIVAEIIMTKFWSRTASSRLSKLLVAFIGFVLVAGLWGTPAAHATGVYSMPNLNPGTWVLDQAGVFSRLTQGELSTKLENLAKATGDEVRLVTFHRLDYGETIEDFTNQLFEKWFPTAEEQANQLLLVLDNVTNSVAIKAGTEVQANLSQETADSIAQETVMVPLRDGNKYNQAFADASDRLVAVLSGNPDPGPPVVIDTTSTEGTFATAEETDDRSATVLVVVLLALATIIPMATYYIYQAIQS
jgi:uncharacterized protein